MKLSERTISVMKNFSALNPGLIIPVGDRLETISLTQTIIGQATLDQTFEKRFAIGDLSKFLGAISLFKDPELIFESKQVNICHGKERIRYTYASEDAIVVVKKKLRLPSVDAVVTVPYATLKTVLKARAVLGLAEIAVVGADGKLTINAIDASEKRWQSAHNYSAELGETDKEFTAVFRAEYLERLLPLDYHMSISSKGFAQLKGDNTEYFVTMESKPSRF